MKVRPSQIRFAYAIVFALLCLGIVAIRNSQGVPVVLACAIGLTLACGAGIPLIILYQYLSRRMEVMRGTVTLRKVLFWGYEFPVTLAATLFISGFTIVLAAVFFLAH